MEINYKEAGAVIDECDSILVTAHHNPDGDAVGSVMALYYVLKRMGKKVCYHLEDVAKNMEYLLDSGNVEFDADYLFIVDVGDYKLLNDSVKEKYPVCKLNIDHHATNCDFAENTLVHSECAAASEVLYNLFTQNGIEIDDYIANCLYLGITTDTGCFKYGNTTADTMAVASSLLRYNVNNEEINRIQFDTKTQGQLEFERMAMNTLKTYFDNKCAVMTLTSDMFEKAGVGECDIHGVTSIPRTLEGVLAGVVIKQRGENYFKISVRTNPPVSASDICGELGGGGHKAAAGCDVNGTVEETTRLILEAVKKHLK